MRTIQLAAMAAALLVAAEARAGLDLINNGDFDNTGKTFKPNNGDAGAMKLVNTSVPFLPGWNVVVPSGANISWDLSASVAGGNPYGLNASSGNGSQYFLDLTGWTDGKNGYGGVSQSVQNTVAGQKYYLTFDIGSSTRYDGSTAPGIQVSINGHALGGPNYATISGLNNWTSETLTFTATGTRTTLLLNGVSAGGLIQYIGLDNVRVTAVPESTTVFAGIGALCLVLFGAGVHSKRSVIRIGK